MLGEPANMPWPQICVTSNSLDALLQVGPLAPWIEWRADFLGEKPPKSLDPSKILWTWRINEADETVLATRLQALLRALHKYARIDMQLDIDEALVKSLRPAVAKRIDLSYHGLFEGLESLELLLAKMRQFYHVRSWKIALDYSQNSVQDVIESLRCLASLPEVWKRKIIFVPMGERFSAWRILAARYLSPFLFCSSDAYAATAKGQLPYAAVQHVERKGPPQAFYGLLGNPVRQSISHLSHNRLLKALDQPSTYLKFPVTEEELSALVRVAPDLAVYGFSVTVPYKEYALKLATKASEEAKRALAANTLIWKKDHWYADNTDLKAFRDIYKELKMGPQTRLLILGAGGSSRAALAATVGFNPKIYLYNRTLERSETLEKEFEIELVKSLALTREFLKNVDLLIQTTSLGMDKGKEGSLVEYPFHLEDLDPNTAILELVNGAPTLDKDAEGFAPTPLVSHAQARGHRIFTAENFFFRQAAYQFESWLEVDPKAVLSQLEMPI